MDERVEKKPEPKKSQSSFYRLCISLVILGTALILRTFFPVQTQIFLDKNISGGMDYAVLLSGVGDSIRAVVQGVPHPNELVTGDKTDPPESVSGSAADGEIRETYDPENEPPPEDEEDAPPGIGGFDLPILWMDAQFFVSEFSEDDTFPLPFGMQKPERVDYTKYELPFETAHPADGTFSSAFGYRIHPIYGDWRFHYGIDISNTSGTPILAFADGTVTAVGRSAGYGNYVILGHEGGFYTLYAHCRTVDVKSGQSVERGQKIASIGSTGVTTGPHLHFELRFGDAFLDPSVYLFP
jgi:murein DD-endopeptidase MepM/ murein hydrolase activator NlpD